MGNLTYRLKGQINSNWSALDAILRLFEIVIVDIYDLKTWFLCFYYKNQ